MFRSPFLDGPCEKCLALRQAESKETDILDTLDMADPLCDECKQLEATLIESNNTSAASTDQPSEQFYTEKTIDKLHKMFPDRETHARTLLNLYKFIFSNFTKQIWEKTDDDVVNDVAGTTLSLDFERMMKEQIAELKASELSTRLFSKRIASIPVFIDFAYLYYIWHFDSNAPIHKLPMTQIKYDMIMSTVAPKKNELYYMFLQCITDGFLMELRIEKPPYMMRTDLTRAQLDEKLKNTIKPFFKDMLNRLLALDRMTKHNLATGTKSIQIADRVVVE